MALSIRAKLFLTLLLASLIAVAGTAAFVQRSLRQGMEELIAGREERQLEEIADRLLVVHAADGGWERLALDRHRWMTLLLGRGEGHGRGWDARGERLPPWARMEHRGQGAPWPPPPVMRHLHDPDRPVPLGLRVMLLDADGTPIYGSRGLLDQARRFPLERDGARVGELAVLTGPPVPELAETRFESRQGGRLAVIALGMLVASAALAWLLSRRLVRPVEAFQVTARRLAAGDYRARVETRGGDEIARLGRDINALASALEQTETARRRWVADISHELRTPVALLRAQLEALQDGVRPLDLGEVDQLHGDVLRLSRLVDDLYQLAMTDLGALDYRMEPVDFGAVLHQELEGFRPALEESGLAMTYDDRRRSPRSRPGDPERLAQLFRNLIANSLKYTDPGGGLWVTVEDRDQAFAIDFQDSPPGVPDNALPHLFERLYRLEASRSRHTGGAGLGLSIAANIVSAHGGTISAAQAPQGGLWVRIWFPDRAVASNEIQGT
jgi:two-component system sensor histidine kinase BaeS